MSKQDTIDLGSHCRCFEPCYSSIPLLLLFPCFSFLPSAAVKLAVWKFLRRKKRKYEILIGEALLHGADEFNMHWKYRLLGFFFFWGRKELILSTTSVSSLLECQMLNKQADMMLRVYLESDGILKLLHLYF